jgi:hypothetical protein
MQDLRVSVPRAAIVATLCALAWVGCNSKPKGPPTVEVTGIVTLNGMPVEGATVLFSPGVGTDDPRLASQATTNSEGKYQLQTHIGGGKYKSGIVPGKYDVTVIKLDTAAIKNTMSPPKNVLPAKYAGPKTSQLKADVAEGQANDFRFPLKSE